MNKHLEKWQPTAKKQLVVYPVGLRKTCQKFIIAASPPTAAAIKCQSVHISSISSIYVRNVIWKWVRWNRRKLSWSSSKLWRGRKQIQIKKYYWNRQEENQIIPPRTFLLSSHPLQNLKVFLMWSCLLLSSLDSFEVFWIQSLTVLRTLVKEKQLKPN